MPFTVSTRYTHALFVRQKRGRSHVFLPLVEWAGVWDEADGDCCNEHRHSTVSHLPLCNKAAMLAGG